MRARLIPLLSTSSALPGDFRKPAAHLEGSRDQWVDIARGIGIILVVWGHVLRANFTLINSPWAKAQDQLIYSFHMPLFFLLAGLFVWPNLARGRAKFLRGRWSAVIWPYLLWSLVSGLIALALSGYVNTPIHWHDLVSIPISPIEQYWFLYALLICQLACVTAYPSYIRLLVVGIAGYLSLNLIGGVWIGIRAFLYLPFVTVGVMGARKLNVVSTSSLTQIVALAGSGVFVLGVSLWKSAEFGPTYLLFLISGMGGSFACVGLAMFIARRWKAELLASLGRASLAIFVLHTIFSAGVRIALRLAGCAPSSAVSVASAFVLGLYLPWMIFQQVQSLGYSKALGVSGR